MNSLLLAIILIPAIEIYLFIKIGASGGAFNTVLLIFVTAFIGIYYAKAAGLSTLNQGLLKMVKEQLPIYELLSGALIAIGAIFFNNSWFCYRFWIFNNISSNKKTYF